MRTSASSPPVPSGGLGRSPSSPTRVHVTLGLPVANALPVLACSHSSSALSFISRPALSTCVASSLSRQPA
eukprot:10314443-Lingulodinium_polyedra.AAC.1